MDLKERPADHTGAYLQAQEVHFIDKFDQFQVVQYNRTKGKINVY